MLKECTPATPTDTHHRLAWLDQLAYELFRVTGRNQLMQCLWLYNRNVDLDGLERMLERLAAISFNRLIEPSPLPWGRPRWVKPAVVLAPLEKGSEILPRSSLLRWANQHARTPIDPVNGPAWRMAVKQFDDGTTAVSFVGSHLILDGMGVLRAIEAAASGIELPSPYLTQGARGWLTGYMADAKQIFADAPRTVAALARAAQASWRKPATQAHPTAVTAKGVSLKRQDNVIELPTVAVTVELQAWNACALRLGGRTSALLPGFVASLACHLGRRHPSDGTISLLVPFDKRLGLDDDRAIAIELRTMTVDPTGLATNLRPMDVPLKAVLREAKKDQTDTLAPLLPAIAWMPRALTKAFVNRMFRYQEQLPVSCSYLGTLPDELTCIDGSPCTNVFTRAVDVNVTERELERSSGHLVVIASRSGQHISLCIEACQLDPTPTTTDKLRQITAQTLAEFGLDAVIEA
jgi:hypothetical protein